MRVAIACVGLSAVLIGVAVAAAEARAETTRSRGVVAQPLERSLTTHRAPHRRDRHENLSFATLPFFDELVTLGDPVMNEPKAAPPNEMSSALPLPAKATGDLPPCREIVAGVLVMRGSSCARDGR